MFSRLNGCIGLLAIAFFSLTPPARALDNVGDCIPAGSDGSVWVMVGRTANGQEQWSLFTPRQANAAGCCPSGGPPAGNKLAPQNYPAWLKTEMQNAKIPIPQSISTSTPTSPATPTGTTPALTPAQQELADWQSCKNEALAKLVPLLNGGTGISVVPPSALQSVGMTIQTVLLAGSGLQIPVTNDADLSMALVDLQNRGYQLQSQDSVLNWGRAMNDATQVPASSIPSEPTTIRIAPTGK